MMGNFTSRLIRLETRAKAEETVRSFSMTTIHCLSADKTVTEILRVEGGEQFGACQQE